MNSKEQTTLRDILIRRYGIVDTAGFRNDLCYRIFCGRAVSLVPRAGGVLTVQPSLRSLAALALVLLLLGVAPVTAETLLDVELSDYTLTEAYAVYGPSLTSNTYGTGYNQIVIQDIRRLSELQYIAFDQYSGHSAGISEGKHDFTWHYDSIPNIEHSGVFYVTHQRNALGQVIGSSALLFFYDWNIETLVGEQCITLSRSFLSGYYRPQGSGLSFKEGDPLIYLTGGGSPTGYICDSYRSAVVGGDRWQNHLTVTDSGAADLLDIDVKRQYSDRYYKSTVEIYDAAGVKQFEQTGQTDLGIMYPQWRVDTINITSSTGKNYRYSLAGSGTDPGYDTVTVNIAPLDARNEDLLVGATVEVRDETGALVATGSSSPNGWYSFTYQLPKSFSDADFERYYSVTVHLDGWTQRVQGQKFYPAFIPRTGDWIRVEMTPAETGPTDPGNAYVSFYVRDTNGAALSGAWIEIANEYYVTNNAGYVWAELPKNAAYPYRSGKSGYTTVSGTATVGDATSYTINIVLVGGTLPTPTQTLGPGTTPTPDPRTNEQIGQALIDQIADYAPLIGALCILATIVGLVNMMTPGKRR